MLRSYLPLHDINVIQNKMKCSQESIIISISEKTIKRCFGRTSLCMTNVVIQNKTMWSEESYLINPYDSKPRYIVSQPLSNHAEQPRLWL